MLKQLNKSQRFVKSKLKQISGSRFWRLKWVYSIFCCIHIYNKLWINNQNTVLFSNQPYYIKKVRKENACLDRVVVK